MMRTRDFFLLVTTVVFLLVVLGGTLVGSSADQSGLSTPLFNQDEIAETSASVGTKTVDRDTRLSIIREKIAAGTTIYSQDTFFEGDTLAASTTEAVTEGESLQLCANYAAYPGFWDLREVSVTVENGQRIVSQNGDGATSSPRTRLLALPIPSSTPGAQNCLSTDVVGVTPAGALLRNGDAVFYRGVNDSVLLGYALDGYPIYGTGSLETDVCGGATVGNQYRYVLATDRETILNCFSGQPASL